MRRFRNALWVLALALAASWSAFAEDCSERRVALLAPQPDFVPEDQAKATPPHDARRPSLVKQVGRDFRKAFSSKETLLWVGGGLGAALASSPFDERIPTSRFNSELFEDTALDHVFEAANVLGGGVIQVGGAFAVFGLGKLTSRPSLENLGRDLVRAQILGQAITQTLKLSVGRTRPDGSNNQSFPSGHASGAFASATVLARHYGWKVGIPAYGFAGYVAASRLNENAHFLSDVVFGAALGILAGRTVTVGRRRARFRLEPMLAARAAGVQFTWVGSEP